MRLARVRSPFHALVALTHLHTHTTPSKKGAIMRKNSTPNLSVVRDRSLVREVRARGKARRRADLHKLTRDPGLWDSLVTADMDLPNVRGYLR